MSDDDVWRLPPTQHGHDIRLGRDRAPLPLSSGGKARLGRVVAKTPEAVVKLTGRARGAAGHLLAQLDYITRNGTLPAKTQDGERITDRARLLTLHDDWLLANAAAGRARAEPNAAQSVALTLSMPPGTPPDRVEAAAHRWACDTFAGTHDWVLARHDDTGHPHVHIAVRAVGADGRRLAPGPADLQRWRERFALELRRLGLEAEATPRVAHSWGCRTDPLPADKEKHRGGAPRASTAIGHAAGKGARAPAPSAPSAWSGALPARQEPTRRADPEQAEAVDRGDAADGPVAGARRRSVAAMPVPPTRQQAPAAGRGQGTDRQPEQDRTAPAQPRPKGRG